MLTYFCTSCIFCVKSWRRVLGTVHHAGLQRLVGFAESVCLRHAAQRADFLFQHLGGLDAVLQALCRPRSWRLVGREDLEAVVPVGQAGDATRLQDSAAWHPRGRSFIADRRGCLEDEGQIEHFELPSRPRPNLARDGASICTRPSWHFHLFLVLVQRAVGVHLDLDRPLVGSLAFLAKSSAAGPLGCPARHWLNDDGLRLGRAGAYGQQRAGQVPVTGKF